jgi:hypothetical protein
MVRSAAAPRVSNHVATGQMTNYHFNSTPTVPWCDCIKLRNLAS